MSNTNDFTIENGVLKAYTGKDEIVSIPNGVTEIARSAFCNNIALKKVTMSNSVTKVNSCSFAYCTALEEVILSNNITKIAYQTFAGCKSLKKISIHDGVIAIDKEVFACCKSLQSITLPDTILTIGHGVFYGCTSLEYVSISNSVTEITPNMFCDCCSLKCVTIPDGVVEIGNDSFFNCALKTKTSCYKAFSLNSNNQLQCLDYVFEENEEPAFIENIELCNSGYHYCTNIFEIFNYYSGKIDKDIAIYEIKPMGKKIKEKNSSKCCCQSFTFKKRLYMEDVIRILNEGSINANI